MKTLDEKIITYSMTNPIDLVYLWVDGSDPKWFEKRNAFLGNLSASAEARSKALYTDNEELKYSVRSALKYAPWIRQIFIVTDEQVPSWLDRTDVKIRVIDHKEILPAECLPCFNSSVIEYFLYRIPDLSEHFIYANDDMFFNAPITPDFFFTSEGLPIVRLRRKLFGKWHRIINKLLKRGKIATYSKQLRNASLLIKQKYGKHFYDTPHHNIDAYKKSIYKEVIEDIFWEDIKPTLSHHLRDSSDIQRVIILFYMLVTEQGQLKYVDKSKESYVLRVKKSDFLKRLKKNNPTLFCLNDTPQATDHDRARIKPFLEALFPSTD
jgi:hypothetical protein